ncbi:cohesin domain-containing protein [Paenibacillus hexagrammi]|uniref:Cohesin domain-containing protein n=1 Tax=Paenibacillus hexagrammi TaxID=2908839 RepID=A0ABY3SQU1_9BACL|nr:cohesin domain-containing protein [Paenibacillus sp. YPD9-1]UJF35485.1 cohesin domain-containing protein [Paenibacillus sp. YPD9-1]
MYKRITILCMSIMIAASLTVSASAAGANALSGNQEIHLDSIVVDQASRFVTIKGDITAGEGSEVTARVIDPNGKVDYMNQTTSGPNGAFAFTYVPNEAVSGDYQLSVGGEGVNSPVGSQFEIGEAGTIAGATLSGPDSVSSGQSFDLTYGLQHVGQEVAAEDITVTYDTYKLNFASATSLDEDTFAIVGQKESPGQVRLLGVHLAESGTNPNKSLMTLTFTAKTDVSSGIAAIAVAQVMTANQAGVETELSGASYQVQINTIDKTTLNDLIDEARQAHDTAVEGNHAGQYPTGAKAALQTAIDLAVKVADNGTATQEQIEQATTDLSAALTAFRNSVITSIPGDHNHDDKLSIGDLAIVANVYGLQEGDEGWEAAQSSDINHDGKIDIEDLAALARLILSW